jgi:hypothetical protein
MFWRMAYSALVSIADWTQTAGITAEDTAPGADDQNDTGNTDSEPLDLNSVAVALSAAVNDHSDENLGALFRAADYDADNLVAWALDKHNTGRSATVLLGSAVMMAEARACDAEEKASGAEAIATEAHKKAVAAGYNCDGNFKHNHENTHAILGQAAHLCRLEGRVTALEGFPAVPANDPAEDDEITALKRQLATAVARLQAVEDQVDKNRAVTLLLPTLGRLETMSELMGRMQVLGELREEAETDRFEQLDRERCQVVEGFRAQLAALKRENAATKAVLGEVLFQFRRMRMYLLAFFAGDLTQEEVCLTSSGVWLVCY